MKDFESKARDDIVRLADLEWLDLSDLIRMDEDWRSTLVAVSFFHLAMIALLSALVIVYVVYIRDTAIRPVESAALSAIGLCFIGMAVFILRGKNSPTGLIRNLRFVVLLSILAVSLIVYLLRDLQGDYYLLYLLPLVSAAGYLGFAGGLFAGIASAFAYAVVFFVSPVSFAPGSISALILRTLVFVLVASLLGLIAERHLSLLSALRASHTQAIQLAVSDSKTGLYNQFYLQSHLPAEISRAERSNTPVSFLVIDVRGLEGINREHGYSMGDQVLQVIGAIVQKDLRVTDIASRWGVDELGVLLYNSDAAGAEIVARRVAAEIAEHTFTDNATGRDFRVDIAEGIATFPVHTKDKTGTELIDRAYQAMRRAKANNTVVVFS